MEQPKLSAVEFTSSVAINAKHIEQGDILIVGTDIDEETAEQMVRLRRAVPSDATAQRLAASEADKPAKALKG